MIIARPPCPASPTLGNLKFPRKLHQILDNAERNNIDHIASWLPCGKAFAIHRQDEFFNIVMPRYFPRMKSYKSFRRQLNLYGMYRQENRNVPSRKTNPPCEMGGHSGLIGFYSHPFMVRGDAKLCQQITRKLLLSATRTDLVVVDQNEVLRGSQAQPEKHHSDQDKPPIASFTPQDDKACSNKATTLVSLKKQEHAGPSFGSKVREATPLVSLPKKQDHVGSFVPLLAHDANILKVPDHSIVDKVDTAGGALRTEVDGIQPALLQRTQQKKKHRFVSQCSMEDQRNRHSKDYNCIQILNGVDESQQFFKSSSRRSQLEYKQRYDAIPPTIIDDTNFDPVPSTSNTSHWNDIGLDTLAHSSIPTIAHPSVPTTTPPSSIIKPPLQPLFQGQKKTAYSKGGNATFCAAISLFQRRFGQGTILSKEQEQDIENEIILTFT